MNENYLNSAAFEKPSSTLRTAPTVSVIVATYNRAHYIAECLQSLVSQTFAPSEIIVVDDGSSDSTADVVRSFGPLVRYVRKENAGKPTAVNLGLEMSRGDWIWIFDDDDVAMADAIERRLQVLRRRPECDIIYGPHLMGVDGPNRRIRAERQTFTPCPSDDRFFLELMHGCFFSLSSALVSRNAYANVGPFDTELLSSEDYDMQLRIARRYRAAYCDSPIFVCRQHNGARGAASIRYSVNERAHVFRRFDQVVGMKLYRTLSIEEYLPRTENLGSAEEIAPLAHLNRARVMGSKGCISEMFSDIKAALSLLGPLHSLDKNHRACISSMLLNGHAYQACMDARQLFESEVRSLSGYPHGRVAIWLLALAAFRLARGYPAPLKERAQRAALALHLGMLAA